MKDIAPARAQLRTRRTNYVIQLTTDGFATVICNSQADAAGAADHVIPPLMAPDDQKPV